MATVRKAVPGDFNKTYPLLEKFNNASLKREDWEQLFVNPWKSLEEYCGYILVEAGRVVGYLGALFSVRRIQGQEYKFCNVTSWIVEREYRRVFCYYSHYRLSGSILSLYFPRIKPLTLHRKNLVSKILKLI